MMNQAQANKLIEDNELAFFRADVCLGSPQSFSLEEKAAICDEMEATNKAIEDAHPQGLRGPAARAPGAPNRHAVRFGLHDARMVARGPVRKDAGFARRAGILARQVSGRASAASVVAGPYAIPRYARYDSTASRAARR